MIKDEEKLNQPVWDEIQRVYGFELRPNDQLYLWNRGEAVYLSYRHPSDMTVFDIPNSERPRANFIIGELIIDYLERQGLTSLTAYSENGISYKFSGAGVSSHIIDMITPHAYVTKG